MKLIITDLDGTLFDTKNANYYSYNEALKLFGYYMEYEYYCKKCNGRHYKDFLPEIGVKDDVTIEKIHDKKKELYPNYVGRARLNEALIEIIRAVRGRLKTAIVTTASRDNSNDILEHFGITNDFDLIITQEDVRKKKPDPEGFLKAIEYFQVSAKETIIFEDTEVGYQAALACGAVCFIVKGFN